MKKKKILAIIISAGIVLALGVSTMQAVYAENTKKSSTDPFRIEGKTLTQYVGTQTLVTVPNNVMIIGENAFEGNETLTDIEFPDYLTSIEYKAFAGCTGLTDVTIRDTVTKVGPGAFMGCENLTSFQIGKSVKSWGSGVFNNCNKLSDIILLSDNNYLTYWDGALYNGDMSFLYQVLPAREGENYVVPSETKVVDTYAFYNLQNVKNIRFAGDVTLIQDYCFKNAGSVENIILSDKTTSIGKKAFADNENLLQVYIPESVTEISKDAFNNSPNVSILTKKNSEADKFGKKYNIPVIYEKILPTDFVDSNPSGEAKPDLRRKIAINTTVEQLTDELDKEDNTSTTSKEEVVSDSNTSSSSITFEDTVTESTNVIGKTIIVNGKAVFLMNNHTQKTYGEDLSNSTSTDNTNTGYEDLIKANPKVITESGTTDYNLVSIVQRTYYKKADLTEFEIDDSIQNIGRLAFSRSGLKSIIIPDNVVSLEYGAFYACEKLEDVRIGNGVNSISTKVFEDTPWLNNWLAGKWGDSEFLIIGDGILLAYRGNETSVSIPEGVKQIGPEAFKENKIMEAIDIPESVEKICTGAFKKCTNLSTVTGCKGLQTVVHGAFEGTKIDAQLY